jgi:hypothetical protein
MCASCVLCLCFVCVCVGMSVCVCVCVLSVCFMCALSPQLSKEKKKNATTAARCQLLDGCYAQPARYRRLRSSFNLVHFPTYLPLEAQPSPLWRISTVLMPVAAALVVAVVGVELLAAFGSYGRWIYLR